MVSTGSFPADREQMGGVAGSVCIVMECPAAVIWELATPAGHLGDQRSLSQLEDALRVCLPSLFVDKILSIEVHPGAIESGLGLPILAESAMVPFSISVDVPRPHPSLLESSLGKQHPLFQGNSFRLTECKLSEITLEVKVVGSFFWRTLSDSSWR